MRKQELELSRANDARRAGSDGGRVPVSLTQAAHRVRPGTDDLIAVACAHPGPLMLSELDLTARGFP